MSRIELLGRIKEALQREAEFNELMNLEEVEEWDSLAILTITSLYDELFSINASLDSISKCKTVADLINLVSDKLVN